MAPPEPTVTPDAEPRRCWLVSERGAIGGYTVPTVTDPVVLEDISASLVLKVRDALRYSTTQLLDVFLHLTARVPGSSTAVHKAAGKRRRLASHHAPGSGRRLRAAAGSDRLSSYLALPHGQGFTELMNTRFPNCPSQPPTWIYNLSSG